MHAVDIYADEGFEDLVERAEASGTGNNVVSVHAEPCGELLAQGGRERIGVAVRGRKFCEDARNLGHGAQRVLVRGELVLGEAFMCLRAVRRLTLLTWRAGRDQAVAMQVADSGR